MKVHGRMGAGEPRGGMLTGRLMYTLIGLEGPSFM